MQFRVLGPLEIESDDGPVVVSGQRPRALLTALLLQPNTLVSTDRLVDALWGEDLHESPANALHQVVTRPRTRLGSRADCIRTEPGGYLLAARQRRRHLHIRRCGKEAQGARVQVKGAPERGLGIPEIAAAA